MHTHHNSNTSIVATTVVQATACTLANIPIKDDTHTHTPV